MSNTARIIIDLALPDGQEVDQRVLDALDALADVMLVQAEDGLYLSGSQEAEGHYVDDGETWVDNEFVLDWGLYGNTGPEYARHYSASVELVDIDHEGSASRQHFTDTGRYLTKAEIALDAMIDPDATNND
jgi:hypothetical protein